MTAGDQGGTVWGGVRPRVTPAVLAPGPAVPVGARPPGTRPPAAPPPRPVVALLSRPVFGLALGQVVSWQVALTLIGVAVGRPAPIAVPAVACATVLLTLTVLRTRERWLYQWVSHYTRYRRRARRRHLPREDGPRAVLHLFAPDAMLGSVRLGERDAAVLNRVGGATAVLVPRPSDVDPVWTLPRPVDLGGAGVAVRTVFLGIANGRRLPLAWVAVTALRTVDVSEEDELAPVLGAAARRMLDEFAARGCPATGLDRTELLSAVTSLAHIGADRRDIRERWHSWHCGRVAQTVRRLRGWAALSGPDTRRLLTSLLTTDTGAVVTVTVTAGEQGRETALLRVAAADAGLVDRSVRRLRTLAAGHDVRLDPMSGEQADGIASVLPLGAGREGSHPTGHTV